MIESTIARNVLLMFHVERPARLLRPLERGCRYSGQILSHTMMLGQLHGAGNTVTLVYYLDPRSGAGTLAGSRNYAGTRVGLPLGSGRAPALWGEA